MEQELHKLLQGITIDEFKVLYLVGISGIIIRFLFNLGYGIWWDPNTPQRFSFRFFVKGLCRIVVSLFVMALVVARFQEFSYLLIDIDVNTPHALALGNKAIAGITPGAAFIIGTVIDDVVKRLMKKGALHIQKRQKS